MMAKRARELPALGRLHVPAVSAPLGGGLIKLGGGSTIAAVAVGAAPYVVFAFAYAVFAIGYVAALLRYVCSGPGGQESMERLIAVSANSIVGILTLSRVPVRSKAGAHAVQESGPRR